MVTVEGVSFDDLYVVEFPRLVRLAALLGADDPEDVAQQALTRLFVRRRRLRDPQAAAGYARVTVINLTRSRLRHLRTVSKYHHVARPVESAESLALLDEDKRRLIVALRQLSRRQREVVVLRYWADMREAQIAEALGIAAGTVKSTCARALQILAAEMEDR